MGYSLSFYSLSWRKLERATEGPEELDNKIARERVWPELWSAPGEELDRLWREAFVEFAQRRASGPATARTPLSAASSHVFVALVAQYGTSVGSIDHASASGSEFRSEFLGGVATEAFRETELPGRLIERPLFHLFSDDYPSWGGLSRAELERLVRDFRQPLTPPPESSQIWLDDLYFLIAAGAERHTDLVTLYE